jgi:hypothetical protein
MKPCSVEAELFHAVRWTYEQMDRQTDMEKSIAAFRNFAKAPKIRENI